MSRTVKEKTGGFVSYKVLSLERQIVPQMDVVTVT